MVQKPLSLARSDFVDKICTTINSSGLPAFVVADALEKVLIEARRSASRELQVDTAKYRAAIEKEKQEVIENGG